MLIEIFRVHALSLRVSRTKRPKYLSRTIPSTGLLASGDWPQRNHTDSRGAAETSLGKQSPHQIRRPRAGTAHVKQKTDAKIAADIWQGLTSLPVATTRERKQRIVTMAAEAQLSSKMRKQAGRSLPNTELILVDKEDTRDKEGFGLQATPSYRVQGIVDPLGSLPDHSAGHFAAGATTLQGSFILLRPDRGWELMDSN
jgi:hypothetical protein